MTPEVQLWKWLKAGLPKLNQPHDVQRIETDTGSGYPDVEGCIASNAFLVELKVARAIRKKDKSFALDHYEREQAYKLHKRHIAGGSSWILIRVPYPELPKPRHYLVSGEKAIDLHDIRMKIMPEAIQNMSYSPLLAMGTYNAEQLWRVIAHLT